MNTEVFQRLADIRIVPVIAIDDAAQALPLADALAAGGLPLAEITFRTPAAEAAIRAIASERPGFLVGAGTVLDPDTARRAQDAGARFAVAPGLNPRVVQTALDIGLPFVPGVATPSDIEQGLEFGLRLLKFFPAEALGGVKLLSAMYAPYKHTGVKFMPTGGVKPDNLASYLACPAVAAVGGTWLAKPADIAEGKWGDISARCAAVSPVF